MATVDATNPASTEAPGAEVAAEEREGAAAAETEEQAEPQDGAEGGGGEEGEGGEGQEQADETDEVELDGKKFRIPKAVRPAVMMHADYTRKTQELAEQRKAWEAEQTKQAEFMEVHSKDLGQLYSLDSQLAQYQNLDWGQLWQDDPVRAGQLTSQHQQLQANRQTLVGKLQETERIAAIGRADSNVQARRKVARTYSVRFPIGRPSWTKSCRGFARLSRGFTPRRSPKSGGCRASSREGPASRVSHGQQLIAKQKAAIKPKPPEELTPCRSLANQQQQRLKDDRRMSTEEWMKWRNGKSCGEGPLVPTHRGTP